MFWHNGHNPIIVENMSEIRLMCPYVFSLVHYLFNIVGEFIEQNSSYEQMNTIQAQNPRLLGFS